MNRARARVAAWVVGGWVGTLASLAASHVIHVHPQGHDGATGAHASPGWFRSRGPLATLPAALARARGIHSNAPSDRVVIRLAPGRHVLSETLRLGPEDSNTTIEGSGGARPSVVTGGVEVKGWSRAPGPLDVWQARLPEVAAGHGNVEQLYCDGRRLVRARTPNEDHFHAAGPLSKEAPIQLPYKAGDMASAWTNDPDARVVILVKWTDLHLPLRGVDEGRRVATLAQGPRPEWMDEPDARYWVETGAALDAPGEWHVDRRTGLLRLIPPVGVDPIRARVVAAATEQLLALEGTSERPLRNVTLQRLVFTEAAPSMPREGWMSPQAAVNIRGSLVASHAVDCRVEHCEFAELGGYGLELGRGCQRWTVVANAWTGLGAGGIRVGEPGDRAPSDSDANHSHVVSDNVLRGLGRVFAPGVGILVFHSGTNRIVHNHVSDLFYTAISVGWTWGYEPSPCRANEVGWNLVENVGQQRLSDMGGIYTLGPQPGTRIHHNLFRDIDSYRYGGWGLYTDEGSTGIVLEDNVVTRCRDAGFHQHYGRDNLVRNNLIAFNRNHQVMRTRDEPHSSFAFTHNIVVHDEGTLLGSQWKGGPGHFIMNHNLYWDPRRGTNELAYHFTDIHLPEWRAIGHDRDSRFADPLLRDREHPERGVRLGSPAHDLGFHDIDLRGLGPRVVVGTRGRGVPADVEIPAAGR